MVNKADGAPGKPTSDSVPPIFVVIHEVKSAGSMPICNDAFPDKSVIDDNGCVSGKSASEE